MISLARNQYHAVRHLYDGAPYHLAVRAALAGTVPAQIFVDAEDAPQIAVLWVSHRLYIAGAPDDGNVVAFGSLFRGDLAAQALEAGMGALKFHLLQDGWQEPLARIFKDRRHFFGMSQCYRRNTPSRASAENWPETYAALPVDAALLARTDLQYLDQLREEMCSERNSVEEFLVNSFGVCAAQEAALAGWCLSEYNFGGECEVGIETLESHQRRGLATAMTMALLAQAAARGVHTVGWHCWANNVASAATALKAGFLWVADYPAGVVSLTQPH